MGQVLGDVLVAAEILPPAVQTGNLAEKVHLEAPVEIFRPVLATDLVHAVSAVAVDATGLQQLNPPSKKSTVETRFYVFFRQRGKILKIGSYVKSNLAN